MEYTRWYDKDNYTRLLMSTLEQLEDDTKTELASDLIQLIIQSNISSNTDSLIEEIGSEYSPLKRRWYDNDETVHSAVTMVKCISNRINGDDKKDLVSEFLLSLISSEKNQGLKAIGMKY